MKPHIQAMALACTASLLLAACSNSPGLPDARTSPPARAWLAPDEQPASQAQTAAVMQAGDWWTTFRCATLDHWMSEADNHNADLETARQRLAEARHALAAQRGGLLPQVSLDAMAGRQKYGAALFGPAQFTIPPFSWYEAGPAIAWTPDFSGAIHQAIARRQALAEYQARNLDALRLEIQASIALTALDYAAGLDALAAAQQQADTDRDTVALVHQTRAAGEATRQETLDAEAQWTHDRERIPGLQQQVASSRHLLAILLGKPPAAWQPPRLSLNDFSLPESPPVSLPSQLAQQRPDILVAAANLHAAAAEAGMAKAAMYPQVTLSANWMQEALSPAGLFNLANDAWAIAAGISAPLFDGGALREHHRAAEHAWQAARSQYRQTVLQAFGQIADALTALDHDRQTLALADDEVRNAAAGLELTQTRQHAGTVARPALLRAQHAIAQAQLQRTQARMQQAQDYVRLAVALGGTAAAPNRVSAQR